jgi:hypothetical protein
MEEVGVRVCCMPSSHTTIVPRESEDGTIQDAIWT